MHFFINSVLLSYANVQVYKFLQLKDGENQKLLRVCFSPHTVSDLLGLLLGSLLSSSVLICPHATYVLVGVQGSLKGKRPIINLPDLSCTLPDCFLIGF